MTDSAGLAWVSAVSRRDSEALCHLLEAGVDFRAMTPDRCWDSRDVHEVVTLLLDTWLGADDHVIAVKSIDTDQVADLHRLGYRLYINRHEGAFVLEHQLYYRVTRDRIVWLRLMSTGLRPRQT